MSAREKRGDSGGELWCTGIGDQRATAGSRRRVCLITNVAAVGWCRRCDVERAVVMSVVDGGCSVRGGALAEIKCTPPFTNWLRAYGAAIRELCYPGHR